MNEDLYVNQIEIFSSVLEFEFNCKKLNSERQCIGFLSLRMNPVIAKAFAITLTEALRDYEKTHGEIKNLEGKIVKRLGEKS